MAVKYVLAGAAVFFVGAVWNPLTQPILLAPGWDSGTYVPIPYSLHCKTSPSGPDVLVAPGVDCQAQQNGNDFYATVPTDPTITEGIPEGRAYSAMNGGDSFGYSPATVLRGSRAR